MSEISIVPIEDLFVSERWDSEFNRPYFRELEAKLLKICSNKVSHYADLSINMFEPRRVNKFNYIEISDIDLTTGETKFKEIDAENTPDRAKYRMQGGEILVSTVRPNRSNVGLLPINSRGFVASSGFAPLLAKNEKWRSYLFVWFKLPFIKDWLDKYSKASMYPAVNSSDILNTPLFIPNEKLLSEVHSLIQDLEKLLVKGRNYYPEAMEELLEHLEWNDLVHTPSELCYIENSSNIERMGRIDAEHFQPKYNRIKELLLKKGAIKLSSIFRSFNKGTQPSEYDDEGEVYVVKSKNVFGQGIIIDKCDKTTLDAYEDTLARLLEGDVVINTTGIGTLGRAGCIQKHNLKVVAAVDIIIMRNIIDGVLPEYVSLFLNSPLGLAQSEMFQTGSSGQVHIYPQHIKEFLLYVPMKNNGEFDIEWQKNLVKKVLGASTAVQEAKEKLELAKQLIINQINSDIGCQYF